MLKSSCPASSVVRLTALCQTDSRPAVRRRRALARRPAASLGSTLGACWDVTQKVVMCSTACGVVVCLGCATTAGGRSRLRALASEFSSTPEGRQAFQLLQYLVLALCVGVAEAVSGVRGTLSLVYLAIAGQQLLRLLSKIPSPAEARAQVEALELERERLRGRGGDSKGGSAIAR
jgi:hypothetical protein